MTVICANNGIYGMTGGQCHAHHAAWRPHHDHARWQPRKAL
jgi:cytochrome c5